MTYVKPTGFNNIKLKNVGTDDVIQPGFFGVRLSVASPSKKFTLPAGAAILSRMIVPGTPKPTAGIVDVGPTGSLAAYGDDISLTVPSRAALTPVLLTADTEINFVATNLDGDVIVALEVVTTDIRI